MPLSEQVNVQFDMHLLGRLTCSVVAVLLISWAYKFYNSRGTAPKPQLFLRHPSDRPTEAPRGTCRNCKMELRSQNTAKHEVGSDGDQQPVTDELTPDNTNKGTDEGVIAELPITQETLPEKSNIDKEIGFELKGDISVFVEKAEADVPVLVEEGEMKIRNSLFGSMLKPSDATDSGSASPSHRRTHCFLQRLQGSVAVGRELRQDLGIQGTYSSFLSKAEIRVEDANLVMEGPGEQSVVQGKIYEYYVESQSMTDSVVGHFEFEGNILDSQYVEFESGGSSPTYPHLSLRPIVTRDLVLPQNPVERPYTPVSPETTSSIKPGLIRKDSYLTAAEHSEVQIPSLTPRTLTPLRPHIQAFSSEEPSPVSSFSPTTDTTGPSAWKEPSLETLAGARFVNLPLENMDSSELESLKAKLDLGNCMEVLELSKKHGHAPLKQAALRVMSDNYLQVLADPGLYGRLKAGERDDIQKKRVRGRQFLMAANMDPQDWSGSCPQETKMEKRSTNKPSSGLYYYDDYKDSWRPLCSIPQEVISKGCAMCTMDNYLFVAVGGCQQGTKREIKPSKRVFCYNPLTSIWKEISPMNESRPHCKLAALQGYIYAIGGECLHTVERYDPCSDRWTFVAPLPNDTFAVAHHVTVCNGEVFVLGGTLRYTMLRYNPKTNAWRKSIITGSKERTADIVGVRNVLYRFDVSPQLGISVYRYHTVARLWYECCTKRLANCPAFQCVAMDNTIYCLSRQFTMRFLADEISSTFIEDDLSILSLAKGVLFPFVLSLPDKKALQTSV
ncbi:kelch domain-containing protein 7A [Esox lucius]|uniref:Kelch domain containing 7A n=1 Tax=Esox lucius TaxID=8010 RepID=A0AAY5JWL7_ESOLU|nr:kelch domain-containing protein 7A [Esox lucius]